MHSTLVESDRSFFRSTECALVSFVAHAGLIWAVAGVSAGGRQVPTDEREARVFFLLPPDRVDVRQRQTDLFQWGKLGVDLEDGKDLARAAEGLGIQEPPTGARGSEEGSGARSKLPFGPVAAFVPDTVWSVLEVDEMVERYEGSAAPAYPSDLLAMGTEGSVQAIYVVDTTGRVDTSTIQVVRSDDRRFSESVLTALGLMRFRPATRGGKPVRQLVEQKFRFRIAPASQVAGRAG